MTDLDRRAGLMAFGGLLLLGGCSRAAKSDADKDEAPGGEGEVTANEDLMREHGVLRRILIVYREAAPKIVADPAKVDAGALATATALFRTFGEQYHEQKLEEQHIFPAVASAGGAAAGLVDTLKAQHQRGREITAFLFDQTRGGRIATGQAAAMAKAMLSFTRMYEAHAAREDTIVFPAFKQAMGPARYKELGEQFEEIERQQFGGDGFDMAVAKVGEVERALGLADLATFTAPPLRV
ncbi:MAG: hemerythrin domain-containing protein [Sphingomonas sp.]